MSVACLAFQLPRDEITQETVALSLSAFFCQEIAMIAIWWSQKSTFNTNHNDSHNRWIGTHAFAFFVPIPVMIALELVQPGYIVEHAYFYELVGTQNSYLRHELNQRRYSLFAVFFMLPCWRVGCLCNWLYALHLEIKGKVLVWYSWSRLFKHKRACAGTGNSDPCKSPRRRFAK